MLTIESSKEELDTFIDRFLIYYQPSKFYTDYDYYHGEMVSTAFHVKTKYNPDLSRFNTYLTSAFLNKLRNLNKRERDWYDHHKCTGSLENYPSPEGSAALVSQYRELVELIEASDLTPRVKEITIMFVTKPFSSFSDLARELGISRERVRAVIESAKQYLKRRNIELD